MCIRDSTYAVHKLQRERGFAGAVADRLIGRYGSRVKGDFGIFWLCRVVHAIDKACGNCQTCRRIRIAPGGYAILCTGQG